MAIDKHRRAFARQPIGIEHRLQPTPQGGQELSDHHYGTVRIEAYFLAALTGLCANPHFTASHTEMEVALTAWDIAEQAINTAPGS